MDEKHSGGRNELIACAWLLAEGYEVFRNVSQHGTADLVAIKSGLMIKVDVKATRYNLDGTIQRRGLSPEQISDGVKCLMVLSDDHCVLDLDPLQACATMITPCLHCGAPIEHFISRPQKFCSGIRCRGAYHRERRRGADQA